MTDAETALAQQQVRRLEVGSSVEVRSRFDASWSRGFEIAEVLEDGYRVRRQSDGSVLPSTFRRDEVRRERTRSTWWL